MTGHFSERTRWAIVMAFAIAMAWVEAASVFYIRALVDRIEPYQAEPAADQRRAGQRRTVARGGHARHAGHAGDARGAHMAPSRRLRGACVRRLGHLLLRLPSHHDRLAEDAAGLGHPVPAAAAMVGPVLAPVSIALVMIVWGTLATQSGDDAADARWAWALGLRGIALALAVFMTDAWRALPDGRDAVMQVLPTTFNWPLFWVALLLMASPILHHVAFLPTKDDAMAQQGVPER